jgi:hypothetical protein
MKQAEMAGKSDQYESRGRGARATRSCSSSSIVIHAYLGFSVFYSYWVGGVSSGSGCCIGEVLLRLMLLRKWRLKALVIPSPRFWMVCIWGVGAV